MIILVLGYVLPCSLTLVILNSELTLTRSKQIGETPIRFQRTSNPPHRHFMASRLELYVLVPSIFYVLSYRADVHDG